MLPTRWSVPMEGLQGTPVPNGPGPLGGGTRNRAKTAVGAYGVHAGDGSSQRPGPTNMGDAESFPCGRRCLWRACRGRQFATARGNELGGRGVLPRWRLVPMECLRVTTDPNGPGPSAGGTGSHAHVAVSAYGGPVGDGSSQTARAHQLEGGGVMPRGRWLPIAGLRGTVVPKRPGPTNQADRKAYPGGGPCLWRACRGRQFPSPGATSWGHGESCQCGAWCLWRARGDSNS